uniref:Uncharacterized protein n=1 Tax=Heterorhabditis bacteriophora TaxID=37862 RepID=A0A1I7X9V5_HETBA
MAETGISMRSFAEPLSANRLRQAERNGELLLRKPLVAPSSSSERLIASNGDGKIKSSERAYDRNGHYSHRFEDTASGVYPPTLDYRETLDEERGIIENVAVIQPSTSRENDETDIEEELAQSFSKKHSLFQAKARSFFTYQHRVTSKYTILDVKFRSQILLIFHYLIFGQNPSAADHHFGLLNHTVSFFQLFAL